MCSDALLNRLLIELEPRAWRQLRFPERPQDDLIILLPELDPLSLYLQVVVPAQLDLEVT